MADKDHTTGVPLTPEERRERHNALERAAAKRRRALAGPKRRGRPPLPLTDEERQERRKQQAARKRIERAEQIKRNHALWRAKNRALELQRQRAAYARNHPPQPKPTPEQRRTRRQECARAVYAADPERFRQKRKARSALKRGAEISDLSAAQWNEIKAAYGYRCIYCGKQFTENTRALTQDHLTAVTKGGPDTVQNIVPSCKPCNSRKHTNPAPRLVQPLLLTIAPAKKHYSKKSTGPVLSPVQPLLLTVAPAKKRKKP